MKQSKPDFNERFFLFCTNVAYDMRLGNANDVSERTDKPCLDSQSQ